MANALKQAPSKHEAMLMELQAMSESSTYRFRRSLILQAQDVILSQEKRINELEEQLNAKN